MLKCFLKHDVDFYYLYDCQVLSILCFRFLPIINRKSNVYFQDIIDDKKVNRIKEALIENFAASNETVNEVVEPGKLTSKSNQVN